MSFSDVLVRLRTLIASNLNALFDSLTDPGAAIDELIANMEAAAREARQQVLGALTADRLAARHEEAIRRSMKEWEERAGRAVQAGDDGLAKEALARRAELEGELAGISADRARAKEQLAELEHGLRDLDGKLAAVKARKETLKVVVRARAQGGGAADRYDQIVAGVDAAEAENELDAELGDERIKTEAVRQKIDKLDADRDADARLAALKAKMGK